MKPPTATVETPRFTIMAPAGRDDELVRLIGLVTVRWAHLDWALMILLGRLLGDLARAELVFYSLNNAKARLDIIRNLGRERVPSQPHREALILLIDSVGGLADARNNLIHSPIIGTDIDAMRLFLRRPNRKVPFSLPKIDKKALRTHADELLVSFNRLMGAALADYEVKASPMP